jgi:hypothetical protein
MVSNEPSKMPAKFRRVDLKIKREQNEIKTIKKN